MNGLDLSNGWLNNVRPGNQRLRCPGLVGLGLNELRLNGLESRSLKLNKLKTNNLRWSKSGLGGLGLNDLRGLFQGRSGFG